MYFFFKDSLHQDFLEPKDAPDISQFRLVDMFHRYVDADVKSCIISSFTSDSTLRVLICTMAFGIGIDCCNVSRDALFAEMEGYDIDEPSTMINCCDICNSK